MALFPIWADMNQYPIWIKPKPIPWENIRTEALESQQIPDGLDSYAKIFAAMEEMAHRSLQGTR